MTDPTYTCTYILRRKSSDLPCKTALIKRKHDFQYAIDESTKIDFV